MLAAESARRRSSHDEAVAELAYVFATPLRPFQLAEHGAPGRHHALVAGIGHIGQMGFGGEHMHPRASLLQRIHQLGMLGGELGCGGWLAALLQHAADDAVGGYPPVMRGRADQHLAQGTRFGCDIPHPATLISAWWRAYTPALHSSPAPR